MSYNTETNVVLGSRWIETKYLGMKRDIVIGYVGDSQVGYNDCGTMFMAYMDKDELLNNYTQLSKSDIELLYRKEV